MSPYYARIHKIMKKYNIDLQWLEFGIYILLPMEVATGMDVVPLRKAFGKEPRICGGRDKGIMASLSCRAGHAWSQFSRGLHV